MTDPALRFEISNPLDVASMLIGTIPVLSTVVLDGDLQLPISQVDTAHELAEVVADHDLRFGLGNLAAMRSSLVRVSCGDSAPPSIRSIALAQLRKPASAAMHRQ